MYIILKAANVWDNKAALAHKWPSLLTPQMQQKVEGIPVTWPKAN